MSSSRLEYLNYTIPIIITVIIASLALFYYCFRKSEKVKEAAGGFLETLQRESTKIRESNARVHREDQIIDIDTGLADQDWRDEVEKVT